MANPHKGEIAFEVGGTEYVLRLGTYALAILERRVKMPAPKFFVAGKEWGADDMLALMYAGLYQHHKMDEEAVADLMDELGSERLGWLILEAVGASGLSNNNNKEEANGSTRPPNPAKAGTGTQL